MKIFIYDDKSKEFFDFIRSLDNMKNRRQRDKLIQQHIDEIKKEITAYDFAKNYGFPKFKNEFHGEPTNLLEKIVKFMYDDMSYIQKQDLFPEDLIESRTEWDTLKDYADEMASLIKYDILDYLLQANEPAK